MFSIPKCNRFMFFDPNFSRCVRKVTEPTIEKNKCLFIITETIFGNCLDINNYRKHH